MSRTILLTNFHVLISRNILGAGIPERLIAAGFRVVVLVPDFKAEYFKERFSATGAVIEGIQAYHFSKSRRGLFFKRLAWAMPNVDTVRIRMKYKRIIEKKRLYYFGFVLPAQLLGRWHATVRLVRLFDYRTASRGYFDALFKRYEPCLIVSTDINNENDVAILQAAHARRIPTVGLVRSWDNLTNAMIRMLPDALGVSNDILKEQAIRIHGMPKDRIGVLGIPHYDRYRKGPTRSREEFFREMKLDPTKRLIFYVPIADFRVAKNDIDGYIIGLLARTGENVLVRFPPAATVDLEHMALPANVIVDQPGHVFRVRGEAELTREDDDRLVNEFSHSDVVVSGPGTMNIDAAVFDKPIILVHFYPSPRSFWEGIREYRYTHIRHLLRAGGTRMAESPEDLERFLKLYRDHPETDHEGRMRIVREQAGALDGHATDRMADFILNHARS